MSYNELVRAGLSIEDGDTSGVFFVRVTRAFDSWIQSPTSRAMAIGRRKRKAKIKFCSLREKLQQLTKKSIVDSGTWTPVLLR